MKWSSPLPCPRPLREVRLARTSHAGTDPDGARHQQEREERAYARGIEDGEKRLQHQLLQQRNELLELQSGVLQSLRQAALQVTHDAESALLDYAFEVAQRIVAEIPISRELVEANLRAALAQVEDTTEFFIHLHPDDLALLQHHNSDLLVSTARQQKMHFLPSPDISRGGCLVRTDFGLVDARRETRTEMLRQSRSP